MSVPPDTNAAICICHNLRNVVRLFELLHGYLFPTFGGNYCILGPIVTCTSRKAMAVADPEGVQGLA